MRRNVTFVGGPLCGKTKRVPESQLSDFIGYTQREREYFYRHCLRRIPGSRTLVVQHRYLFLGHKAELPDGLEEVT